MLSPIRPLHRPVCSNCFGQLPLPRQQVRHATLLKRPRRPYTFTQLVTLSDGSAYLQRTTSPLPVYKSTKDTRNTAMWNPSSQKLLNVEADEAGRLRAFRDRFGRGWDAETAVEGKDSDGEGSSSPRSAEDSLLDLISGFGKGKTSKNAAEDPGKDGNLDSRGSK